MRCQISAAVNGCCRRQDQQPATYSEHLAKTSIMPLLELHTNRATRNLQIPSSTKNMSGSGPVFQTSKPLSIKEQEFQNM